MCTATRQPRGPRAVRRLDPDAGFRDPAAALQDEERPRPAPGAFAEHSQPADLPTVAAPTVTIVFQGKQLPTSRELKRVLRSVLPLAPDGADLRTAFSAVTSAAPTLPSVLQGDRGTSGADIGAASRCGAKHVKTTTAAAADLVQRVVRAFRTDNDAALWQLVRAEVDKMFEVEPDVCLDCQQLTLALQTILTATQPASSREHASTEYRSVMAVISAAALNVDCVNQFLNQPDDASVGVAADDDDADGDSDGDSDGEFTDGAPQSGFKASAWAFDRGRRDLVRLALDGRLTKTPVRRQRFRDEQVQQTVTFLLRPDNVSSLSWDEKRVRVEGEVVTLPGHARKLVRAVRLVVSCSLLALSHASVRTDRTCGRSTRRTSR